MVNSLVSKVCGRPREPNFLNPWLGHPSFVSASDLRHPVAEPLVHDEARVSYAAAFASFVVGQGYHGVCHGHRVRWVVRTTLRRWNRCCTEHTNFTGAAAEAAAAAAQKKVASSDDWMRPRQCDRCHGNRLSAVEEVPTMVPRRCCSGLAQSTPVLPTTPTAGVHLVGKCTTQYR